MVPTVALVVEVLSLDDSLLLLEVELEVALPNSVCRNCIIPLKGFELEEPELSA